MLKISQAAGQLGVTPKTLRQWEQEGKIHPVRTPGGQRRYPQTEINRLLGVIEVSGQTPRCAVYARVSSQKQAQDGNLDRQRDRLELYAARKGYVIVKTFTEVASEN
jgi:excisionase family DNA binding protein